MTTKTIPAYQLQPGQIVIPAEGNPRQIALARCEGAHPYVVVHWVGTDTRTQYPAGEPITIKDTP